MHKVYCTINDFVSALAGLGLVYALQTLDLTQFGVRMASEVENLMTSVERVMMYTEIDSEPGYSTETHPPESWPIDGSLVIQDLSLIYYEGGPRVLKNISFCVSGKEKIGIVGRTGAGKSSLISALFHMPDPLGKVRRRQRYLFVFHARISIKAKRQQVRFWVKGRE